MSVTYRTEVTLFCDRVEHEATILTVGHSTADITEAVAREVDAHGWLLRDGKAFCPKHVLVADLDKLPSPRFHVDPSDQSSGFYFIQEDGAGQFRWAWQEPAVDDVDCGDWVGTRAAALRDAAADWEDAGSGGYRLAATMRAAATRSEKEDQS